MVPSQNSKSEKFEGKRRYQIVEDVAAVDVERDEGAQRRQLALGQLCSNQLHNLQDLLVVFLRFVFHGLWEKKEISEIKGMMLSMVT
jgi:hypothetical protein